MRNTVFWSGFLLLAWGCEATRGRGVVQPIDAPRAAAGSMPGQTATVPAATPESAPGPSDRLPVDDRTRNLPTQIESHFTGMGRRALYIQVDKPIYKPGETIWVKTWDLKVRDHAGGTAGSVTYQLVNPKGATVATKRALQQDGKATNDFVIADDAEGGEYQLRVRTEDGKMESRAVVVSSYEAPRIKKTLEFLRKAYGPGDEVKATLTLKRPTGEALTKKTVKVVVQLDGQPLPEATAVTNDLGGAVVSVTLPKSIERGDGLLTVLVEDGGITESIGKSIPIVLNKLQLSLFPEGGDLVAGVPSRLYFEAKTTLGKPADIEGRIVDDQGQSAGTLATFHFGLGRTMFTPSPGRSYHVEVTRPVGIVAHYPVPAAREDGCTLRSFDDFDGILADLRVAVSCATARTVVLTAVMRDNALDTARVKVVPGTPSVVYLRAKDVALGRARGVARVTLFSDDQKPLAERLLFRNRRAGLRVELVPDQKEYGPREQVALTVKTSDSEGRPVPGEIAVSVVDDTVVSFADDKTGHILSRLLLETEIPEKVEEPKFFFDLKEAKAAQALDLLMGTRGYRRFDWQPVFAPPLSDLGTSGTGEGGGGLGDKVLRALGMNKDGAKGRNPGRPRQNMEMEMAGAPPPLPAMAPAAPAAAPAKAVAKEERADQGKAAGFGRAARPMAVANQAAPAVVMAEKKKMEAPQDRRAMGGAPARKMAGVAMEMDAVRAEPMLGRRGRIAAFADDEQPMELAPVRVFPAPNYAGAFDGVRSDFRETIHWAPQVRTDAKGKATLTFYLSDAVTSFRIFAEGAGGGLIGRSEEVFKSSLPFSMNVKLPVEVSAGDSILVPLTMTNERKDRLAVDLRAEFAAPLKLTEEISMPKDGLAPQSRASVFYPVTVGAQAGLARVSFAASAGGLKDEFVRQLNVVPLGFPQTLSKSGQVKGQQSLTFDTGQALPGSLTGKLTVYPSPTATLLSGLDGMLQEPGGCFEQTSSSNYPNVMVLDYLKTQDKVDPQLLERVNGMLDRGYKKLTGFETQQKGFEWFGQTPAHEALTAYGVLEFADMKRAWGGVDDAMLARTVAYLRTRRDGKGGFSRNDRALDSFGGANPEVTNAYIMYAMTEAGFVDFGPEIEAQAKLAANTQDPYVLALSAMTLMNVPAQKGSGLQAARRLATMAQADGHFAGKEHSITRSTGHNLDVETTALAALALMKSGGAPGPVRSAIEWLVKARAGQGTFGATQATVLALKALTQYTVASKRMTTSGQVEVRVNGKTVATKSYETGRHDPLVFEALGGFMKDGANVVDVVHRGSIELPYALFVEYRSVKPAIDPRAVVGLTTALAKSSVKMGDAVRMMATLTNRTSAGQPMTIARVGLPGGLAFQNWQLKELVEKKTVDFYETRGREVTLYLRQMAPSEIREIPLDLVATIPGSYTGPASQAYLYYTDDQRTWVDPIKVQIDR